MAFFLSLVVPKASFSTAVRAVISRVSSGERAPFFAVMTQENIVLSSDPRAWVAMHATESPTSRRTRAPEDRRRFFSAFRGLIIACAMRSSMSGDENFLWAAAGPSAVIASNASHVNFSNSAVTSAVVFVCLQNASGHRTLNA